MERARRRELRKKERAERRKEREQKRVKERGESERNGKLLFLYLSAD